MQVACFVFIQRRWVEDKKHMENMLDYFCDIREPLQLLLFPEGTDLTGEKETMEHPHIQTAQISVAIFRSWHTAAPVSYLCTDAVM